MLRTQRHIIKSFSQLVLVLASLVWGATSYALTPTPTITPTDTPELLNRYKLSAGVDHTCALNYAGVKCWGLNQSGQTTVPVLSHPVTVGAGYRHSCALDDSGVVCWGDNYGVTMPSLSNPTLLSVGPKQTCAIDDSGMACWGFHSGGVPALTNPSMISAGWDNVCAMNDTRVECWAWGSDFHNVVSGAASQLFDLPAFLIQVDRECRLIA